MVATRLFVLAAVTAAIVISASDPVGAVALRPNKATDDSVCDLTHHTNDYLGSKTLIPSVASSNDQIDAYFRLAAHFIASNCRDGQLLLLQGSASSTIDARSLTEVANSSCAVASVGRSEISRQVANWTVPFFDLRCTISKHGVLVRKLEELERADPMESLKTRMVEAVRRAEGGSSSSSSAAAPKASSQSGRDCSKLSLASILYRGAPCD